MSVRAKKGIGQHFLKDRNLARKITDSLKAEDYRLVLEIGPGMGILTEFLYARKELDLYLVELDRESVTYLKERFPVMEDRIYLEDFLRFDLHRLGEKRLGIIGNFPYYISSQILFRILHFRDMIAEVVGMFQKEVAERIAAGPGSRRYGILSVLTKAFFDVEYLFTVNEKVFVPPPRVKSAVIRLKRNPASRPDCDEELFFSVVKTAFNQRRKVLRNALKTNFVHLPPDHPLLGKRAEQLSVEDFAVLTRLCSEVSG